MGADTHARVKHLLAEALTRPTADREAFVRAQSDDVVLVREVLELLAEGTDLPALPPVGDEVEDEDLVGTQVGHYRILDRIDGGGQGEVYLGRDSDLRRKVALKSLLPSGAPVDVRAAALREARVAAQVSHPNVATIHHVLEHNSRAFIVMEFVEGESLAKVLQRGRLPLASVYAIGRQLTGAVAAAHAKGVVHRDLKPANVQVLPDGSIKVLDFGIAGVIAAVTTMTRGRASEIAQAGQPGTPGYMAPEQVTSAQFDERTDIFSLGILLFEMATGRRAYPERETQALLTAAMRPLPRADAVAPDVPRALADLIEKAVAIEPAKRFDSVVALGRAIEAAEGRLGLRESRSATRQVLSGVAIAASAVAVFVLSALLETAAFNKAIGREPPFDAEAAPFWLEIGARSLLLPALVAAFVLVLIWVLQFVWGVLALLPVARTVVRSAQSFGAGLVDAGRLRDPRVLARAAAAAGILSLAAVVWSFRGLLEACMTSLPTAPATVVAALADGHLGTLYRALLAVILVGCGWAWLQVRHLDRAHAHRGATVAPVLVVAGLALFLMQFPYRLLSHDEFALVMAGRDRCGVVGRTADELLLFCAGRPGTRVQRVPVSSPDLRPIDSDRRSIFNMPGG